MSAAPEPHEIFRDYPELETPRLRLRRISFDDLGDIFAYAGDPEVTRYTVFDYHRSPDETREFIARTLASYGRQEPGVWGIEHKLSHFAGVSGAGARRRNPERSAAESKDLQLERRLIGSCGMRNWDRHHARAEIGYVIHRAYWNRGLGTEAVGALLDFGFRAMQLNRIEAKCVPANAASRRLLEKLGMRCEGILRQHEFFKSAYQDLALYSILRSDYTAR